MQHMLALGIAAALLASVLFNVGIAFQGIEARAAPKSLSMRVSLLGLLLRRPRWILGWLLGIVGIGPQVLAFGYAPFVVVQPALASGLLVLLFLAARTFKEPITHWEVFGVFAITGGVALVAWGAPSHVEAHRGGLAVISVFAGLSACCLAPFAVRGTRFDTGMLAIVASGCGFGATNIATKLLSDDAGLHEYGNAAAWAAAGLLIGVAATITGMTAFQRRRATAVVPVSTAVQTFLPIVLEPFFLREHWSSAPLSGAPIAAGLLVALVGTVVVSRDEGLGKLAAGSARPSSQHP
jgi:drug/metabolite transporter (DMT)-like permease